MAKLGFDGNNIGKGNTAAALLFIASSNNAIDVFSATNSSPWTAESFGGDPAKAASLWRYVTHAVILTSGMNIVGAVIARSWWPIAGAAVTSAYMVWLYQEAVAKSEASGSQDWGDKGA